MRYYTNDQQRHTIYAMLVGGEYPKKIAQVVGLSER